MQKSILIFKALYCRFSVLLKNKTGTSLTYFTACILSLKALQIQIWSQRRRKRYWNAKDRYY